jgi:hypothetical protein
LLGSVPVGPRLKGRLEGLEPDVMRKTAWELTSDIEGRARDAGCAGVVLMGLKFDSLVDEAPQAWR